MRARLADKANDEGLRPGLAILRGPSMDYAPGMSTRARRYIQIDRHDPQQANYRTNPDNRYNR